MHVNKKKPKTKLKLITSTIETQPIINSTPTFRPSNAAKKTNENFWEV